MSPHQYTSLLSLQLCSITLHSTTTSFDLQPTIMFSGPTRGGTRGGAAEFKWSDVKEDKDREHYLGHSVMAAAGRWQKNQDIHWYSRDQETADEAARKKADEVRKIKEAEEDALALALGFAPAVRKTDEEKEVERLMKDQQKQEKALRKAERHAEKLIKAEIKANVKAERKALKATSHASEDGRSPKTVDKEKGKYREREDDDRDRHASRQRDDDRSSRHRYEERTGGREYSSRTSREPKSERETLGYRESKRDKDGHRGQGSETAGLERYRTRSRSPNRRSEEYRRNRSPVDRDRRTIDRPYDSRDREDDRGRERRW